MRGKDAAHPRPAACPHGLASAYVTLGMSRLTMSLPRALVIVLPSAVFTSIS